MRYLVQFYVLLMSGAVAAAMSNYNEDVALLLQIAAGRISDGTCVDKAAALVDRLIQRAVAVALTEVAASEEADGADVLLVSAALWQHIHARNCSYRFVAIPDNDPGLATAVPVAARRDVESLASVIKRLLESVLQAAPELGDPEGPIRALMTESLLSELDDGLTAALGQMMEEAGLKGEQFFKAAAYFLFHFLIAREDCPEGCRDIPQWFVDIPRD